MLLRRLLFIVIAIFCTGTAIAADRAADSAAVKTKGSPWQFEAGASAGRPAPIMLNAGVGYNNIFVRVMGGGLHLQPDEYWVGFRGSADWEFFRELPFSIDLGISGGYTFAKAPNGIYKAMNRANKKRLLRSYNYKEAIDISAEVRANIYGVFTYVAVPVHCFMKHDEPSIIWQVGYAYRF